MSHSKRIEKFVFLKVWCMLLVVIVHTLINSYGDVGQELIRFFCLCYTMPMFAFISGWFSKEEIKYCIIDNHITISGSYNWTDNACEHNDENIEIIQDWNNANICTRQFLYDWNKDDIR